MLVIGIGAQAYHVWHGIIIHSTGRVEYPLGILHYPSELNLSPGETKEFNVTVQNHVCVNYFVLLDSTSENKSHQDNFIMFSNETCAR